MGFRIGKKVGDYYISTGKSGTRISRKVGDFNVSYWSSNKKSKAKPSDDGLNYSGDWGWYISGMFWNLVVFFSVYLTFTYYTSDLVMGLIVGYMVYFFIHCFLIVFNWDDNDWSELFIPFFAPVYLICSWAGFWFYAVMLGIGLFL